MAKKKPMTFRLSAEAVACLDDIYNHGCGYGTQTAIVEDALLQLWERKLGLSDAQFDMVELL